MDALQAGITAAQAGRQAEAQALLRQALEADPRSEQGWLWMSAVVESDVERRTCLERVLDINPYNQTAQAGLDSLSSDKDPGDNGRHYLPISRPVPRQPVAPQIFADPTDGPTAPHSMPTLGTDSAESNWRPIQRLAPLPEPEDQIARLRASSSYSQAPSSQSDPVMATVLLGGLSITALAGALILFVLWLIGWPP
jgi:hypothetical protein